MKAIVALRGPRQEFVTDALNAEGVDVLLASSGEEAENQFLENSDSVNLLIVDGCVGSPQARDGDSIITAVKSYGFDGTIVGITCCDSQAVGLMRAGCFNFVADNISLADSLRPFIREAKIRMGVPC